MSNTQQRIDDLVKHNDIVLFMKGSASFPMCGFSGRAVQILKACGVEPKTLKTVNVLEDDAIRQGIKEYSNWPTIPQLYVKGEFIGGSDIMMEMYESGELQQAINGKTARASTVSADPSRVSSIYGPAWPHRRAAANTALGYSGLPRLPLYRPSAMNRLPFSLSR